MKLHDVKILADENVSPKVVEFLRQSGLDVLDVKEQGWYGLDDKELLVRANKDERFVLTHDSDFGTLAVNEGSTCYGIVYLRIRNLKSDNVIEVCKKLLLLGLDLLPGTILVVQEERVRIRHVNGGLDEG